jgi:membrane protease YdiL (CAAX protease family)
LYYYHSTPSQFQFFFSEASDHPDFELHVQYWKFIVFFILAGLIPFSYLLFSGKTLTDFGLGIGDYKTGLKLIGLLIPLVIIPLIWIASHQSDIRETYPMARSLFLHTEKLWHYELMYIIFYYISWEFFFRGFLLFGLIKEYGIPTAILIQTISSCLIHLGKPEGETLGSIVAGILFGIIAVRTKSIWYVWIIHFCIGVLTDYFVLLQSGISF